MKEDTINMMLLNSINILGIISILSWVLMTG